MEKLQAAVLAREVAEREVRGEEEEEGEGHSMQVVGWLGNSIVATSGLH